VKQHLRRFNDDKCKAIGEEILKLLSEGFIREVYHPEWLANPVLVKKKNKKWRICVDYTSLNKACPKDLFPLPRIDQVVDSTVGCETLCFLDAYSGYHQIAMCIADQLATSFITPFVAYCYQMMPFGIKKCGRNFPTMHAMRLRGVDRSHHRSVRRRHRSQVEENRGPGPRPHRGLREATTARGEAEP
jgi:hypothetical protein